jgi:hypothetical protein
MRVGEISKATIRRAGMMPVGGDTAPDGPAAGSRALVALTPAAASQETPQGYRQAAFLAQLLAIKDQHPQTRERRRAEPGEAIAAYRATAALTRFR